MATTKLKDEIRAEYLNMFSEILKDEDLCRTAVGTLEFPVARNGEEMWVRVAVSIPKYEEDDDGYARAQEYAMKRQEADAKKQEREAEKARKAEERERKKREKEIAKGKTNSEKAREVKEAEE